MFPKCSFLLLGVTEVQRERRLVYIQVFRFTCFYKAKISSLGESKMSVKNIFLVHRRKTHPCLFFEVKASTNSPSSRQLEPPDKKQCEKQTARDESETKINANHLVLLEQIQVSKALAKANAAAVSKKRKKTSTAEDMAIRRENVVRTLNQRRDAVCKEIERSWFIQGAYLEKHRHNLQVTHRLRERGLMWP